MVLRALQSRDAAVQLATANTEAIARTSAQSLDATIAGTRSLLLSLREHTALRQSRAVNDSLLAHIDVGSTIPFADLRIFDTTGVLLGASNYQQNGPAPAGMLASAIFRRARETRDFTVGSVRRARTLPGQPLLLSFALPVVDTASNAVIAYVTAAIFPDSLATLHAIRSLPTGSVLTLTDSAGTIVYRSLDFDRWIGRTVAPRPVSGAALQGDPVPPALRNAGDDADMLIGTERLAEVPWRLSLSVPVAPTLVVARQRLWTDLLVGSALVLLVLGFCYRAALGIVRPIEALTADVGAIAAGEMTRRSTVTSNDELGDLSRALNRMADTIAERDAALQASQAQLLQSQKMDALGQLAGGIAHDFNNYLHAIVAHTEMVHGTLPAGSIEQTDLDEVLAAADRAAMLTRQILVFSRKQIVEPTVIDANEAIAGIARLLRTVAGDERILHLDLAQGVLPLLIDAGEFEQVLVNLASNARDATTTGGRITVSTCLEEHTSSPEAAPAVVVSVTDDGTGIPADVRARLFDPFFTTKQRGRGTGLGLAIVFGIVHNAGGRIDVESTVGQGTTFRLRFPRSDGALGRVRPAGNSPSIVQGTGLVLVVDDDAAVLRSSQRMLEVAGYRTITASGRANAFAAIDSDADIDLLLTDVIMPGVSGPELAAAARARRATIAVLYMTGYAEDDLLLRDFGSHAEHCIRKPFTTAQLSRAIQAAMHVETGPSLTG